MPVELVLSTEDWIVDMVRFEVDARPMPLMLFAPAVIAPPSVNAGSVVESDGTPEEFVTRMEDADDAVMPNAFVPRP